MLVNGKAKFDNVMPLADQGNGEQEVSNPGG